MLNETKKGSLFAQYMEEVKILEILEALEILEWWKEECILPLTDETDRFEVLLEKHTKVSKPPNEILLEWRSSRFIPCNRIDLEL